MRTTPTRYPHGTRGPSETNGIRTTLAGSVAASAAVVLGTLAVLYPVAGAAVGASAVTAGLVARAAWRVLRRRRTRRGDGRLRRVCIPTTDVCVAV